MSGVDAVSIFAEGTFKEQVLELVSYLARGRSEEEQATYLQPFDEELSTPEGQEPIDEDKPRQKKVFTTVLGEVKGLGEGSEREIEGFFNLLFAHFLKLFPDDSPETKQHLSSILQTISSSEEQSSIKYRILSNLFNTIPRHSALRLPVHQTLVTLSSTNGDLDHLQLTRAEVDKWISEWNVTPEEKSNYLKSLVDAFAKAGQFNISYGFQLSYVRSIPPSPPSSQAAAADLVATALRLPTTFDFDPLLRLDAVVALKSHGLITLLQIFLNDGLAQYKAWSASNASILSTYNLDNAQLERKIRLLTLATLGFQNLGRDIPYTVVASIIQVQESEVERWVIDAIRAKLITAKLSQITRTVLVSRATVRAFEHEQWETLEKRLVAWRTGLTSVLEVVAAAKRRNNTVSGVGESGAGSGLQTPAQQVQEAAA